jgi:hypothetical protein
VSKLYYVELKEMKGSYGSSYVVADNPDEALKKVQKYLEEKSIGFYEDKEKEGVL